jgi:hypothetical protein
VAVVVADLHSPEILHACKRLAVPAIAIGLVAQPFMPRLCFVIQFCPVGANFMRRDPVLAKYKSNQDVTTGIWTTRIEGDEVIGDFSIRITFTINRPVADTWKYMRDFNLWLQDLHYNSIVGDEAEGNTIYFSIREKYHEHYKKHYGYPSDLKKYLIVRRTVAGKLIVWEELSEDKRKIVAYHIWALSEHDARTTVTGVLAHAPEVAPKADEEQMRTRFQSFSNEIEERWTTFYIPRLRQLVESG